MGIFRKWDKTEGREVYYIDYYDEQGKRIRESTGASSYSFAKELLTQRKDEVAKRKRLPERYLPRVNFSEFVDNEYLPIHARGMKNESNIKGICKKLKVRFGGYCLHEITSKMIEIYKKERLESVAHNTINNELNTLSGIFTKAVEWGKAQHNPVHKIKRFRITERRRILERQEQHALIISAGKEDKASHLQALIIFDVNTGLRKEELLSLKWSDIDYENQVLQVRAETAKYSKSRYVDLNKHALAVLHFLPRRGEYIFCDSKGRRFKNFRRSFDSAVKRAGLEDVVIHDLRRTFGSNCVMAGVSLATVQAWMGHASINTTIKHYGHLVKSFRKEEIKKIEGRMDTYMDTCDSERGEEARNPLKRMVPPAGFEPAAPGLGNLCSILLS